MPKRSAEYKIAKYKEKIKRLKTKHRKNVISDSSDFEQGSGAENNDNIHKSIFENTLNPPNDEDNVVERGASPSPSNELPQSEPILSIVPLEPEILMALGDLLPERVIYGPNIHPDLAQRWAPILRKGLMDKDQKDKLINEYAIPENCKLFRAPQLNPEIAAAVSEFARARDKKIETFQQQLGIGLTAINRATSILLESDDKVRAIKCLSDATRILSDLHALDTQTRSKSLLQGLDKSFLNLIQDCERDEMLFGTDLPEKIKASKAIEKQGSQIKKPENKNNPGYTSSRTSTSKSQGNWRGNSRSTNRGGRGGAKRTPYVNQKFQPSSNPNPNRNWNRPQRAGQRT